MRADFANLAALVICLGLGMVFAVGILPAEPLSPVLIANEEAGTTEARWTTDARGVAVPIGAYRRIVSLNPVADHILLQLVEPERLVGITAHTGQDHPEAWRFGSRPQVGTSRDIEQVLNLRPDLVISSQFSPEAYMARLREAGVAVFDLGDTRDAGTTAENIETLGSLLAREAQATRLLEAYRRELDALSRAAAMRAPASGIYLTYVGGIWFGGTRGSSYGSGPRFGPGRRRAAGPLARCGGCLEQVACALRREREPGIAPLRAPRAASCAVVLCRPVFSRSTAALWLPSVPSARHRSAGRRPPAC